MTIIAVTEQAGPSGERRKKGTSFKIKFGGNSIWK